jgi:hypothetical protein
VPVLPAGRWRRASPPSCPGAATGATRAAGSFRASQERAPLSASIVNVRSVGQEQALRRRRSFGGKPCMMRMSHAPRRHPCKETECGGPTAARRNAPACHSPPPGSSPTMRKGHRRWTDASHPTTSGPHSQPPKEGTRPCSGGRNGAASRDPDLLGRTGAGAIAFHE